MSPKPVETRVAECVEIRKQLFEVGLLAPAGGCAWGPGHRCDLISEFMFI
jgi:hypothetical protein